MSRRVRGALFADYVRMIRSRKDVDWSRLLPPRDLAYVHGRADPDAWYPMETFERMGDAILSVIAPGNLDAVRAWGQFSAPPLVAVQKGLVAPGDPVDTLMRFRVLRNTFFDFPAIDIPTISDGAAQVTIAYHMGATAEEAASWQTLGFCEALLGIAGAREVEAWFAEKSWAGAPRTLLELRWRAPD